MNSGNPIDDFSGVARLFPLPDFVLLPHVVKPLHVFEPRYRALVHDALATDELMAIVLLKSGWEPQYHDSPPIHDMACLARIIKSQELLDGRYNILVRGECRLQLDEEILSGKPYRMARGTPLPDEEEAESSAQRDALEEAFRAWLTPSGIHARQVRALFEGEMSLAALCDVLAFAMPLAAEVKQALLEELDVSQRVERLMSELRTAPAPVEERRPTRARRRWPPDFSTN